ncbi:MAG TPA: SHOCT domain-containing protein [Actinomycetales bacterium]|nr:SHOCT domain-containing protein [Actinomycetales bacterium]
MDASWWDHVHGDMDGVMGQMHGYGGWGFGLLWLLVGLLLVGALVAVVLTATGVWSGGRGTPPPVQPQVPPPVLPQTPPPSADPAESLLRERFARGEIDENEFEQRLNRLRATHRSP